MVMSSGCTSHGIDLCWLCTWACIWLATDFVCGKLAMPLSCRKVSAIPYAAAHEQTDKVCQASVCD